MPRHITTGSQAHKELFCRFFIDSHIAFDAAAVRWPVLEAEELARLRSLPFWAEAVATEYATTRTIQAWAARETEPLLHQALALQAYEEQRHAALLHSLTRYYDIPVFLSLEPAPPADVEWAFLCTGYSECFDAFFSFALFALARDSGFFPPALVELFEPIMQEEARHILFFVNWEAYHRAQQPVWQRPRCLWRGAVGRGLQMWHRLQTARGIQGAGEFTLKGHQALPTALSPRGFLELCLRENERRLGAYDARLLRPRLVPALARALSWVLR
jgi:hypothetical protein